MRALQQEAVGVDSQHGLDFGGVDTVFLGGPANVYAGQRRGCGGRAGERAGGRAGGPRWSLKPTRHERIERIGCHFFFFKRRQNINQYADTVPIRRIPLPRATSDPHPADNPHSKVISSTELLLTRLLRSPRKVEIVNCVLLVVQTLPLYPSHSTSNVSSVQRPTPNAQRSTVLRRHTQ